MDAITEFPAKTGRTGFPAMEFRFGAGKPNEAFLIPWEQVRRHFEKNEGMTTEHCRDCIVLTRSGDEYTLENL